MTGLRKLLVLGTLAACGGGEGNDSDARARTDAAVVDARRIDAALADADPAAPDADPAAPDADLADAGPDPCADQAGAGIAVFAERIIDDVPRHGQGVEVIDFDGDGDDDVVVAFSLLDGVTLYRNDGCGAAWTPVVVAPAGSIVAMDVAVADYDGDGDLDVAAVGLFERAVGNTTAGEVTWYEQTAGGFVEREITGPQGFQGARTIAAADLDGDDVPDLVVGAVRWPDVDGQDAGGVFWFRNTGGAFDTPVAIDADLADVVTVRVADIDGDTVLDVIAAGRIAGGIKWYENDRAPGTTPASIGFSPHVLAADTGTAHTALAQMDGDAALELVAHTTGGIVWLDPPADPTQPWTSNLVTTDYGASRTVFVYGAQLDGQGGTDVAIASFDDNDVRVRLRDGAGFTDVPVDLTYAGANFVTGGDFNGDGHVDLLTTTYNHTGTSDTVAWWINDDEPR